VSPEDAIMLRARDLARHAHAGQTDKSGQDYYRAHVADVAHRVGLDPRLRAVAYLHDVVEDTSWTMDALAHVGFPGDVLLAVDAITHRPHEDRLAYYARVKANPLALAVKHADIASNTDPNRLALLTPSTRTRLIEKYEQAKAALL
jgi:(p)ppGpp synthase/HD superfamily hydrolase